MVGLGNPGAEFAGTRHNVGAEAVSLLAERHHGRLRAEKGLHAAATTVNLDDRRVVLAIPQTFMNDSGRSVAPLLRRAGLDARSETGSEGTDRSGTNPGPGARLIIVHDELDLPPGRVKIKVGGGNAGHNGLKSVEGHLHGSDYARVRIGIGKPPGRQSAADFVLKRPGREERLVLDGAVEAAADAVEAIVAAGAERAMSQFNDSSR